MFNKEKVQCTKTLTAHDDTVEALVVDQQQNSLYSASWDHTIKVDYNTRRHILLSINIRFIIPSIILASRSGISTVLFADTR